MYILIHYMKTNKINKLYLGRIPVSKPGFTYEDKNKYRRHPKHKKKL